MVGGKLISACHGEDIHKCSSFFATSPSRFRILDLLASSPFSLLHCCSPSPFSVSPFLSVPPRDCSASCTIKICLVTLVAYAFVNKHLVETRCSRRIDTMLPSLYYHGERKVALSCLVLQCCWPLIEILAKQIGKERRDVRHLSFYED